MTDQDSTPNRSVPLARLIVSGDAAAVESVGELVSARSRSHFPVQMTVLLPDALGNDPLTAYSFEHIKAALHADRGYAWSWHCNLAMPMVDSIGVTHQQANKAAAALMRHMFGVDVTQFPEYKQLKLEETA